MICSHSLSWHPTILRNDLTLRLIGRALLSDVKEFLSLGLFKLVPCSQVRFFKNAVVFTRSRLALCYSYCHCMRQPTDVNQWKMIEVARSYSNKKKRPNDLSASMSTKAPQINTALLWAFTLFFTDFAVTAGDGHSFALGIRHKLHISKDKELKRLDDGDTGWAKAVYHQ